MFQKLRTARYLKASARSDAAVVEFTDRVQRIARVHQLGLKDKPNLLSQGFEYPERQLLGFSTFDKRFTEDLICKFLT